MSGRAADGRLSGVLLGTAIGDALGLPLEGMSPATVQRRFIDADRYRLFGRTGFVSDDTEQTALVAQCLARHPVDLGTALRAFRRSMIAWFLRLPWGIGFGTLRACLRMVLGFQRSGVSSAGNGAAMRAAILGAFFRDDRATRRAWSDAFAQTTHTDPRAVNGARFVAELAALSSRSDARADRVALVRAAIEVIDDSALRSAIERAGTLADSDAPAETAGPAIGTTGFVLHTVPLATFFFLRHGDDPLLAIVETIRAGGDTDTNAAIVGAWVGALHGEEGLPSALIDALHDGPFGRSHLLSLAKSLDRARRHEDVTVPTFSSTRALLRNVALFPVVLFHAFRVVLVR